MKAVILAGGRGTRLRPYTTILPKPLMPIGELPVLDLILRRLSEAGFRDVILCVGYLGELIRAYCSTGERWGIQISYSSEPKPLGTIGPLQLIREQLDETFLVTMGDVLTDIDYRELIASHRAHGAIATVATYHREVIVDFGVFSPDSTGRIIQFSEKPAYEYFINMGIYCFEPQIFSHVPLHSPFGFDELMHRLIAAKIPVHGYQHTGWWLDIGRQEDYERANSELSNGLAKALGLPEVPA